MKITTKNWSDYWINRKIDWNEAYLKTDSHPHRFVLSAILKTFDWISLLEIGCGSGPNILHLVKTMPGKQLGGVDINPDAIALAEKTFKGGVFRVGSAEDMIFSDKSSDVILSDMCLIYVGPRKIKKYLMEVKRIARSHIVLCEFHSERFFERLKLRITSGYNAYNYKKILDSLGFYDIALYKLTEEDWPGGNPQKEYGYVILAKVPKR